MKSVGIWLAHEPMLALTKGSIERLTISTSVDRTKIQMDEEVDRTKSTLELSELLLKTLKLMTSKPCLRKPRKHHACPMRVLGRRIRKHNGND